MGLATARVYVVERQLPNWETLYWGREPASSDHQCTASPKLTIPPPPPPPFDTRHKCQLHMITTLRQMEFQEETISSG